MTSSPILRTGQRLTRKARGERTGKAPNRILVLGIGNELCQDDGIGPVVVRELARIHPRDDVAEFVDGGTVGLALLTYVEGCDALIVIDAASLDAPAGHVAVLEGGVMDAFVAQPRKRSAHEVGLADLLGAAALIGALPERRALIAIQPESTQLGDVPTPTVGAAVAPASRAVLEFIERWKKEEGS